MRVLYLITKSETGGAQTHITQLCTFLKEKGDDVAVMAHPGGWLERELQELGIPFFPNNHFKNTYNPCTAWFGMSEIRRVVKEWNPDIVSCHSSIAGFWGRLALRKSVPTIFTAHGWAFTPGTPRLRGLVARCIERLVARYCHRIICVSNFDADLAKQIGIDTQVPVAVIHNGVELISQKTGTHTITYPLQVVFVGRMDDQKDPFTLIRAIHRLQKEHGFDALNQSLEVQLIGDGPILPAVEQMIQESDLQASIRCVGKKDREKVLQILTNEADVFVLTSNWEGFPRSILEAMSAGVAVIASDVGGVRESVTPDIGWCIQKGDDGALSTYLWYCVEHRDVLVEKSIAAQQRVRETFSLANMCEQTYAVYQQVVSE